MTKICIIEDDNNLREGLRRLLELNNYLVYTASDGIEGLKKAKETIPDVIVSDIIMPGLDGFHLKEILNSDKELSTVPFIFLTGKAEMKSLREGLDLGADDYLIKPFNPDSLLKTIDSRLKHYREIRRRAIEQDSQNRNSTGVSSRKHTADDILFINLGNPKPKLIRIGDIKTIEVSGNYSRIFMDDRNVYTYRKSIKAWEECLDASMFLRIHRSIIVNLRFIEKISRWSSSTYLIYIKEIEKPFNVSQRYASRIRHTLKL